MNAEIVTRFWSKCERMIKDKYRCYCQLAESERRGKDYRIRTRERNASTFILAPHGGGIEPGTSEIAWAMAAPDYSFYALEGIKGSRNRVLHVTSTNFDEPRCLSLVTFADRVVAIHGEDSKEKVVLLGGRDELTFARLRTSLEQHGFKVKAEASPGLQGRSENNVCNKGRSGAGVQIEISHGLRRTFFARLSREGRKTKTPCFRHFIAALKHGLRQSR